MAIPASLSLDVRDLPDEEELLGPMKMKKFVDLSADTLRKEAQNGLLPHVRIGRRYLFPKKTLLRFLTQRAMESVQAEAHEYRS